MKVILALDLGTTGNRAIAFSKHGKIVAQSYLEFPQIFPKPGWVEHSPQVIWSSARKVLKTVVNRVGKNNVLALGITNQRETTILWNKKTGKPYHNAIVWQCRRTTSICEKWKKYASIIKRKTGLFLDPYFSASKIRWLIDHIPAIRRDIRKNKVAFGTVDSWILWQLTKGKVHASEASNASRTMCFNIQTKRYDSMLLQKFGLPRSIFPKIFDSNAHFGDVHPSIVGKAIPILSILGDQQAALYAHGGWQPGVVKNTYGTGLFVVASTGPRLHLTKHLINTIAWTINGKTTYAAEGSIFIGGSAIQWLRDKLEVISKAGDSEKIARSIKSSEGVYFVPALSGLGAPHWDPNARGLIIGLTRGTTRAHIVRATLESLAYQTADVIHALRKEIPSLHPRLLRVDGGATQNNFLMQFQADVLNMKVQRSRYTEMTALGTAGLAAITTGFWTQSKMLKIGQSRLSFKPRALKKYKKSYLAWQRAVSRSKGWNLSV